MSQEKPDPLFSKLDLRAVLQHSEGEMLSEIESLGEDALLNTSLEELSEYYSEKFKWTTLSICEATDGTGIRVEREETKVNFGHNPNLSHYGIVRATRITYIVPYTGDAGLLTCYPSTRKMSTPYAVVRPGALCFSYTSPPLDAEALKDRFSKDLSDIKEWLQWIQRDVAAHNDTLARKALCRLQERRSAALNGREFASSLGYPLAEREGAPKTYAVQTQRRKLPEFPKSGPLSGAIEPSLLDEHYEHILSVIGSMVQVMELSPRAFKGMKEEDLRQQFLVQLNGHYVGAATAETFNYEGKTDILIRVGGKNIFVAECKFWDGPASLTEAINQILNYSSWKDTKTAVLVFNRTREFSTVLEKIRPTVEQHPCFVKEVKFDAQSGFRFVLHHKDDSKRELILTVLAFEVPA